MTRSAAVLLFISAAVWPLSVSAQNLTPQQVHGRQILTQNCNVCHLPQESGSQKTYGPRLDKSATNGDDNLMRDVITNGLVRMPAWKYTLKPQDVNDIIAYVRTIPPLPAAAPAAR